MLPRLLCTNHFPLATALLLTCSRLSSQEAVPPPAPGATAPAPAAEPAAASTKPAKAATPEEQAAQQLGQQLLQVNIARTVAAMLEAQSDYMAKGKTPPPPGTPQETPPAQVEAQAFAKAVISGDWAHVGAALRKLPEPLARQVFQKVGQLLQTPLPNQRRNRQQVGTPDLPIILPPEVLQLADAAPFELQDADLTLLGGVLKASLTQGFPPEPLLKLLDTGTSKLGGADPAKRLRAAQLLTAAGLSIEAVSFLPSLDDALKNNQAQALLIHAQALLARALKDNSDALRLASWQVVLTVLGIPNLDRAPKSEAMQQCLGLMDQVPPRARAEFLRKLATDQPQQARDIAAAAAEREGSAEAAGIPQQRAQALQFIKEISAVILQAHQGEARAAWIPQLNLMALPWADEAVIAKGGKQGQQANQQRVQRNVMVDNMGNPINDPNAQNQASVPPDKMLEYAPDGEWLAVLQPTLAQRVKEDVAELAILTSSEDAAVKALRSLAAIDPEEATEITARYIQNWAQLRNPSAHQMSARYARMFYSGAGYYYYGNQPQGIPITRSFQQRNLEEFAVLLGKLKELPLKPLQGEMLANAFAAMHSAAEVFRQEDIEKVFGPPDKMDPEILSEIIDTMRQRLASAWRNPQVQDQAGTKRVDKDITAEVERGYDAATDLIDAALESSPKDWRYHLIHAALSFDWAEFQYGNKADLSTYVGKREESFDAFAESAKLYGESTVNLPPSRYSVFTYVYWFNANLGASDLSYVTRQQEPSMKSLDRVRQAMLDLPGEAPQKHLDLFATSINGALGSLPPHLKHPYAAAAIRVLGDHPMVRELRELLQFYTDLLSEVEFRVALDGDSNVGRNPFGIFVSLRYTDGIGREAGGFKKYLTNQTQMQNYYNSSGYAPQDYRDQFEKQVKEKFQNGFDVLNISFADPKDPARGIGRQGWRETPYAYLLVKARDPKVDQIPALKLDLDFSDRMGQVVLPKLSTVTPIDSRADHPPARPVREVEVTQILDERELAAGKATLDIKATGKGVLPDLDDVVDLKIPGFSVGEINTVPVSILKLATDDAGMSSQSERSWLVNLKPSPSAEPKFQFPAVTLAGAKVAHKAYQDADLLDVPAVFALQHLPAKSASIGKYAWLIVVLVIALLAGGAWLFLGSGRRQHGIAAAHRYRVPEPATPFNVVSLLQKLRNDPEISLNAERKAELDRAIQELEAQYFSPGKSTAKPAEDLTSVAGKWLRAVGM